MADVDVQVQYTTTERKTRKVKKTSKRRESKDGEVAITEVEQTNTTTTNDDGYVSGGHPPVNVTSVCAQWSISVPQRSIRYRDSDMMHRRRRLRCIVYLRSRIMATLTYPT